MDLSQIESGTVVGGFKLEKELGRGGMGVVFKAHELSLNRKVALKILSERLSNDEEFITRFKREAKVVAALGHPNIVGILSFGEEQGLYYFAMEYVQGTDLGQILKERKIPLNEALYITAQVADALEEGAGKGVVHRDLKPSNIMIDSLGRIKVTDYGIAYFQDSKSKLTKTGLYMGTPEYSSPEQARGQKLDIRSDIYSLGSILYRMLSGKKPVTGESPLAVVAKIMTEPVEPISKLNPQLPKLICQLVEKMMAKEIDWRFQTPAEVMSAINYCVDKLKIEPPPTKRMPGSKAAKPPQMAKRNNVKTFAAAAGIIVAILLSMWTVDALFNKKDKKELPVVTESKSVMEVDSQVASSGDTMSHPAESPVLSPTDQQDITSPVGQDPRQGEPTIAAGKQQSPTGYVQPQDEIVTPDVTGEKLTQKNEIQSPVVMKENIQSADIPIQEAKVVPPAALPVSPVILTIVSGDETLIPSIRAQVESGLAQGGLQVTSVNQIPVLVEKVQMGDTPITWYNVNQLVPKGTANILLLSEIQKTGTMPLKFYGRTQTLTNVIFTIRAVDMETGVSAGLPATGTAKFTPLNINEELRKAVEPAVKSIADEVQKYWQQKRAAEKQPG